MAEEKTGKKRKDDNGDPFWSRILIFSIILIWVALVAGNWIGHYVMKSGVLGKKATVQGSEFKDMPAQKPKIWKQPVKIVKPTETPDKDFQPVEILKDGSTASPAPDEKPEESPSPSPSPEEEDTPVPSPSPQASPSPEPVKPSPKPSPRPSPKPSPTVTETPKETASPSPQPEPSPEKTPEQADGSFSLQVGNFSTMENAEAQVATMKEKGYSGVIVKSGDTFKVLSGDFKSRQNANETKEKMITDGINCFVVEN